LHPHAIASCSASAYTCCELLRSTVSIPSGDRKMHRKPDNFSASPDAIVWPAIWNSSQDHLAYNSCPYYNRSSLSIDCQATAERELRQSCTVTKVLDLTITIWNTKSTLQPILNLQINNKRTTRSPVSVNFQHTINHAWLIQRENSCRTNWLLLAVGFNKGHDLPLHLINFISVQDKRGTHMVHACKGRLKKWTHILSLGPWNST
jgi:hypothetical protein